MKTFARLLIVLVGLAAIRACRSADAATTIQNSPARASGGSSTPDGGVKLSSLSPQSPSTVVGVPADGGVVAPSALTQTQLTALVNPATSSLSGAMSAALAANLANVGAGSVIPAVYIASAVDLTAPGGHIIAPAVAGKTFFPIRMLTYTTAVAGAITGNATIEVGQTGALANLVASGTSLTNAAAFAFGVRQEFASNVIQTTLIQSVDTLVTVTVGATGTGGFAWNMDIMLYGFYR